MLHLRITQDVKEDTAHVHRTVAVTVTTQIESLVVVMVMVVAMALVTIGVGLSTLSCTRVDEVAFWHFWSSWCYNYRSVFASRSS